MVFNSTLVEVNSTSGEVTLASPPDYEMGETVSIQVISIPLRTSSKGAATAKSYHRVYTCS